MPGRIVWHRLAEEDLGEAYLHLAADSPAAAERLVDAVERAASLPREQPGAGRPRHFRSRAAQGLRSWVVSGFEEWLISYRRVGDDLEVVRFLHGARDLPRLLGDEHGELEGHAGPPAGIDRPR